jgi:hyperosmotically inducible periplasmic protein
LARLVLHQGRMRYQSTITRLSLAAAFSFTLLCAQQPDSSATQPDNTRVNKSDRDASVPTADQAKNNKSDRETMAKIRRALMHDKTLSTDAHNVKVIAQSGTVTLSGPVRSDDEKKAVEEKAASIAGRDNVTSQITVKNNTAERSQ